jgi:hypothetical protein
MRQPAFCSFIYLPTNLKGEKNGREKRHKKVEIKVKVISWMHKSRTSESDGERCWLGIPFDPQPRLFFFEDSLKKEDL